VSNQARNWQPKPRAKTLEKAPANLLALYLATRAAMKIGDVRATDDNCRHCGGPRNEVLTDIAEKGGQSWEIQRCRCRQKRS
jgi:hypothetical protein